MKLLSQPLATGMQLASNLLLSDAILRVIS